MKEENSKAILDLDSFVVSLGGICFCVFCWIYLEVNFGKYKFSLYWVDFGWFYHLSPPYYIQYNFILNRFLNYILYLEYFCHNRDFEDICERHNIDS
jgi:hypothetical protein